MQRHLTSTRPEAQAPDRRCEATLTAAELSKNQRTGPRFLQRSGVVASRLDAVCGKKTQLFLDRTALTTLPTSVHLSFGSCPFLRLARPSVNFIIGAPSQSAKGSPHNFSQLFRRALAGPVAESQAMAGYTLTLGSTRSRGPCNSAAAPLRRRRRACRGPLRSAWPGHSWPPAAGGTIRDTDRRRSCPGAIR